jgi:hypothetical protein
VLGEKHLPLSEGLKQRIETGVDSTSCKKKLAPGGDKRSHAPAEGQLLSRACQLLAPENVDLGFSQLSKSFKSQKSEFLCEIL